MITSVRGRKYFIFILLLFMTGAAFRFYFIHAHSSFMQSDEAVLGLMAKHIITRRQFPIFMWGQERNGVLIAYLVAPFFYLLGASNLVFKTVTTGLSLIFAYLVYLLAKRISSFSYGLFGVQWTANEFTDLLHDMGIPAGAYRAYEFDQYVLYDVPQQYLDPAVIIYERLPPQ